MTRRTNQMEKPVSSNPTEQAPPQPPLDPPATPESGRKPFEDFLGHLPGWKQAALRAYTRWPAGREVTQTEFDTALKEALGEVVK